MPTVTASTVLAQLHWRYATQGFDSERKITTELWNSLEEALVLSPSSFGLQPWKFLVITDPAVREELLPAAYGQRQFTDASHLVIFCANNLIDADYIERYILDISDKRELPLDSLHGLKRGILSTVGKMDAATLQAWAANQCYIALGNFMTAASMLGVDTCPMEGFSKAMVSEILDLEGKGLTPVVCCPAGYRSVSDKYAGMPKVRWDKELVIQGV